MFSEDIELSTEIRVWGEFAKCKGQPAVYWYPESMTSIEGRFYSRLAKDICGICPVKLECLKHAKDNEETFGIWGGLTPAERGVGRLARPSYLKLKKARSEKNG